MTTLIASPETLHGAEPAIASPSNQNQNDAPEQAPLASSHKPVATKKKRKKKSSKSSKSLSSASLSRPSSASSKPGVLYLSRVPPGLDVGIVRSILARIGALGRVWLRAESAEAVAERRSLGGRRRAGFTDGWVEFARAEDAAAAVDLLNGQPMAGATRRGRFQNDLWCLRLLPNFSWDDLVDEACGTRRERVLRVKREVAAARREKAFVEQRAALATSIGRSEEKRRAEAAQLAGEGEGQKLVARSGRSGDAEVDQGEGPRMVRRYRQKRAIGSGHHGGSGTDGDQSKPNSSAVGVNDDIDERRAMQRLEREEAGDGSAIDQDLIAKLFKRQRR